MPQCAHLQVTSTEETEEGDTSRSSSSDLFRFPSLIPSPNVELSLGLLVCVCISATLFAANVSTGPRPDVDLEVAKSDSLGDKDDVSDIFKEAEGLKIVS